MSTSGAATGFVVGAICVAAGWSWGILLLLFFLTSSILSRVGAPQKRSLTGDVVEKGERRDAWQVVANGGFYTAAALGVLLSPSPIWYAFGAGALAAATADTWATEIGTLRGGIPISIITGRSVPTGTSGGISLPGSLAGIGGALFIAVAAALAKWPVAFAAVALGGIAGALSDSILGATLQAKRFCDRCGKSTERVVHDCGNATRDAGGIRWLDNDIVNAISTGIGAVVALVSF